MGPEPGFGNPNEPLNKTITVDVLLGDQIDQNFNGFVTLKSAPSSPLGIPLAVVGTPSVGSQPAVAGVATFPNFTINQVGQGFMVLVTDAPQDPPVTIGPITILPHNLQYTTTPSSGVAGLDLPQVVVQVQTNPGSQPDALFQGAVQLTLADAAGNPLPAGGATLQNGTVNLIDQSQAVFSNLIVSQPGTYSLIATIPGSSSQVGEATSALSRLNFRVEPLQFDPCFVDGELPIDGSLLVVDAG